MISIYLLVTCICVTIASILYLFYWNRFIAFLISIALRVKYWNHGGSSIWIKIGSIHLSLIAGRILMKDLRYHSSNQTIKIVKVQIMWRYWLRQPAKEDDLNRAHVGGEDFRQTFRFPSCRIKVSIQGFEWFLYNRTATFDYIVSQMLAKQPDYAEPRTEPHRIFSKTSGFDVPSLYPPSFLPNSVRTPQFIHTALDWVKTQMPYLDPKDLLPVALDFHKGAIIFGNPSMPNGMVVEFHRAEGTGGIVQSRSKHDLYKQLLNLKFQNVAIRMVENDAYQDSMLAIGHVVHQRIENSKFADVQPLSYLSYRSFYKIWKSLKFYKIFFRSRHNSRCAVGHVGSYISGRRFFRTPDAEKPADIDPTDFEYAIEREIFEAPSLELSYYVDVVGDVPTGDPPIPSRNPRVFDIGNGDLSPEWGIDIVIRSGSIRYGPWADRQRAHLQRIFFPQTYDDMAQTPSLKPGDKRLWTALTIFIELREETTLYIPFREASKNWQWDGKIQVPRPRKREAASIHVTAGDSSTISYHVPMVVGPQGYESRLEVHLDTLGVTSSLNDIKLVVAESCRVHGELPSALKWNEERHWVFNISLRQPVLYILRDHINMFTDLSRDWTSGSPTPPNQFVPMHYSLDVDLHQFQMHLYANDQNIIDKPLINDENSLVIIRAPRLHVDVVVPSNKYRPEATTIPILLEVSDVYVSMSLPKWNTQSLYSSRREHRLVHAGQFQIKATYHYYAEVHIENIEQLKINVLTRDVSFKTLGWAVRYLMVLRDNYLGSFTHFSTLTEYLDKRNVHNIVGDPLEMKYRPDKSNTLEVEISVLLEGGSLLLPAAFPGYEKLDAKNSELNDDIGACVLLAFPELQLDFRLHDYFMDMSMNMGTLTGVVKDGYPAELFLSKGCQFDKEMFIIDGLDITANRLFGPQPRTRTYVCVWEINVGHVSATMSVLQSQIAVAAVNTVGLNFTDLANAPASEYGLVVDPDVTFVRLALGALNVTLLAGSAAVDLSLPRGITLHTNDLAGHFYSKIMSLRLPHASFKVLLLTGSVHKSWVEVADCIVDVDLDLYRAPPEWEVRATAQREFIHSQDAPTLRAKFLFQQLRRRGESSSPSSYKTHQNPFYLPPLRVPQDRTGRHAHSQSEEKGGIGTRWSRVSHLSESEGEENITDAARDARLAKSRFSFPAVPLDEYEENMSGSDESDDEDLTDSESLETASFSEDQQNRKNLLMRYYHATKRYSEYYLDAPSQREGSPFVLSKDSKLHTWHTHNHRLPDLVGESTQPIFFRGGQYSTTVRAHCSNGVEVRITPLLVPVTSVFMAELQRDVMSPELSLDAMMSGYLASLPSPRKSEDSIFLDLRISSVSVQMPQHVTVLDEQSSFLSAIGRESAVTEDLLCILDLFAGGCHVLGGKKPGTSEPWGLQVEAESTSIVMGGFTDRISPSKGNVSLDRRPINTLKLSSFHGEISQDTINVAFGEFLTEVCNDSPRFTAGMCVSVVQELQESSHLYKTWKRHTLSMKQKLIYEVLQLDKDRPIVDPLSTIQPSFLVQHGRPQDLRTDTTFKFFFHLRSSLATSHGSALSLAQDSVPDLPVNTHILLRSCINALAMDVDASDTISSSLSKILFPGEIPLKASSKRSSPGGTVITKIGRLNISIYDDLRKSPSQFSMTSFTAHLHTFRISQAALSSRVTFQLSSLSPRDHSNDIVQKTVATVSAGDMSLIVSPHLMTFVQHVLHTRRQYNSGDADTRGAKRQPKATNPSYGVLVVSIDKFRFQAAAENLIFEFGGSKFSVLTSILSRPPSSGRRNDQSGGLSIQFGDIFVRARSKQKGSSGPSDQDVLASVIFTGGKSNALLRQDPPSTASLRLVLSLDSAGLAVPRSAIRLYRFVEEWRADFLPGMEAAIQTILAELKSGEMKRSPPEEPSSSVEAATADVRINGCISTVGIALQVMHGTWLSWNIHNTTLMLSSAVTTMQLAQSFGVQFDSQVLSISYKPQNPEDSKQTAPSVKLRLPSLFVAGNRRGESSIDILASLDFIDILVKPSHWDTLLAVQQKFGHDFADLMALIEETRRKRMTSSAKRTQRPSSTPQKYRGHLRLKGFRLGLEGPSSIFYLGCKDVGGEINNTNGRLWQIKLRDLTISLAPRTITPIPDASFSRNDRLVFVTIDLHVSAGMEYGSQVLEFDITKMQAVMQPSSIGEMGDFIDHMGVEMQDRREQRATELAAFKEKTRSVLKTFDIKTKNAESESKTRSSWLSQRIINITIYNIGVAFPLTLDQHLELPQTAVRDTRSARAFLFSIKSIRFSAQRGEAGELITQDLSLQFIPCFRQSVSTDFIGSNHETHNRLLYPEMKAQLRSNFSVPSRLIQISANVSGFVLDLDSTIPDFVFSLVDVYRQGEERMARLTGIPRSLAAEGRNSSSDTKSPVTGNSHGEAYSGMFASVVFATLTFQSGQVHIHTGIKPRLSNARSRSLSLYEIDDLSIHEAETIKLPVVSVWAEYRASSSMSKSGGFQPSILIFKSTIHSSHNTLRPTLLPFITEVMDYVQLRLLKASRQSTGTISLETTDVSPSIDAIQNNFPEASSPLQINLSLRIDKSHLELTCQPDVNVTAGLRWDSGGFVVNISPGAHKVTFTGSVDGLTAGLKHGFLSEDCVNLDARNLAFTATFGKTEDEGGNVDSTISLVLDTDISGGVRFSRLQDVLCFKAVWLDHIPLFIGQPSSTDKSLPSNPAQPSSPMPKQELATIFLVRLRRVKVDIDLGQSISTIVVDLQQAVLRSKFCDTSSEVSLSVSEVLMLAKGNISGRIHVPDCVFQTIHRHGDSVFTRGIPGRMLDLSMTSGPLNIDIDSDHQRLLFYRAEPLQVEIHDDWSLISPDVRGKDHPLILSITVIGTEVVAVATVGTIPKLISYAHRFKSNLEVQEAGASRESLTFRATQSPKPDNALSEVANAMLHSARNRFKEAETELSYVIRQHMSFQLASLRVILFPRSMMDLEMAHFIGCNVHASLDRVVTDGLPSWREVYLAFSKMTISKFSQPHQFLLSAAPTDPKAWLDSLSTHTTEAIIVGLPSMKMHMITEEIIEEHTKDLEYDFHSEFVGRRDGKNSEDIYITLNVSLYSWLTILRKNLSREMEQVRTSVDWRAAPTSGAVQRKKGPVDQLTEESQDVNAGTSSPSLSSTIYVNTPSPSTRALSSVDPRSGKPPAQGSTGDSGTYTSTAEKKTNAIVYIPRERHIERLTMRQLGEATPDVMHPFFMKTAGFNLEDSLPQYVHEYATIPLEEIMEALLKLYSKQLRTETH